MCLYIEHINHVKWSHDCLLYIFVFACYSHYKSGDMYVKITLTVLCNWFLFLFCSQDSGDSSSVDDKRMRVIYLVCRSAVTKHATQIHHIIAGARNEHLFGGDAHTVCCVSATNRVLLLSGSIQTIW